MKTKLIFSTIFTIVLSIFWVGCQEQATQPDNLMTNNNNRLYALSDAPDVYDLFAGQDILVGEVQVWNDKTDLSVKFVITDPDWCLEETHLHVATDPADLPQTKKGNAIPGQFDYKDEHECVSEFTYTIPMSDIGVDCDVEELVIAAHAVVEKVTVIKEAPYTGDNVVDSYQGRRSDGSLVRLQRSNPDAVLSCEGYTSESTFFTLGYGGTWNDVTYDDGWIVIEFDPPVTRAVGPDLLVTEVSPDDYPDCEKALVYGSNDGIEWVYIGIADNSTNYVGNWNNTTALEFPDELEYARYIKLVDNSIITDPSTRPKYSGPLDAYDIRCVQALNDYVEIEEETAWGFGPRFIDNNWATYIEYTTSCPSPCDPTIGIVYGMAVDANGNSTGQIWEIDVPNGTATHVFTSTLAQLNNNSTPNGVAYDGVNNRAYYANYKTTDPKDLFFWDGTNEVNAGTLLLDGSSSAAQNAAADFYDGKYYYILSLPASDDLYEVTFNPDGTILSQGKIADISNNVHAWEFYGDIAIKDGILYGWGKNKKAPIRYEFFTYNLSTGIFDYDVTTYTNSLQLAFGSNGTILYGHDYYSGAFRTIDITTGAVSAVISITPSVKYTDCASGQQCQ